MHCNIDARGKAARLILGIAMILIGVVLLTLRHFGPLDAQPADWPLFAGIASVLFGAFGVFEGWAGWCAVRAMGFKTRV